MSCYGSSGFGSAGKAAVLASRYQKEASQAQMLDTRPRTSFFNEALIAGASKYLGCIRFDAVTVSEGPKCRRPLPHDLRTILVEFNYICTWLWLLNMHGTEKRIRFLIPLAAPPPRSCFDGIHIIMQVSILNYFKFEFYFI